MRLTLVTLLLAGCAQYRLVAIEPGMNVNLKAVQSAIGFTWPREHLNQVRSCKPQDPERFEVQVTDLENCVIATTTTTESCPPEYERLMIRENGIYRVADLQLVTICLE